MKKLKAAVIGCGNISVMHLDSIRALGNIQLVGVCDIRMERAQAAAEKYNTTVEAIMRENHLTGNTTEKKCKLLIPKV